MFRSTVKSWPCQRHIHGFNGIPQMHCKLKRLISKRSVMSAVNTNVYMCVSRLATDKPAKPEYNVRATFSSCQLDRFVVLASAMNPFYPQFLSEVASIFTIKCFVPYQCFQF